MIKFAYWRVLCKFLIENRIDVCLEVEKCALFFESGPRKWGKMKHMAVFLAAGLILGSIALLSLVFFVVRAARIRRMTSILSLLFFFNSDFVINIY
jgi:hypothetical protein